MRAHKRVAVLIDLSFFLAQYRRLQRQCGRPLEASVAARAICTTAGAHVGSGDDLHRIFVYDCKPLAKKAHHPISGRAIDFSRTPTFAFRTQLLEALLCKRHVVVRLGELADRGRWQIRPEPTRRLLNGSLQLCDLREQDVVYDVGQKGVDIKMSLDIAVLAHKRLVDRIVLITGESDFVPAAKLARRKAWT